MPKQRKKNKISIEELPEISELKPNKNHLASNNWLGYKGIKKTFCNTWVAQISVNNERIYIGTYDTELQAALAYDTYILQNQLSHKPNFIRK